jgi:hypothetical protein
MGKMKTFVRAAFILLSGVVMLMALYILIICYPHPFFRYSVSHGNIHLYSTAPIPGNAGYLLKQVQLRLEASPIYDGSRERLP